MPPDEEGRPTNLNKHHNKPKSAPTVRFEMPFAIWCTTCKPHETIIGQGVRFNAEKKRVGSYYSTPVFSFRMRHTACGGWIEIRTDPKNTAYVVTEGARKRETADDQQPLAVAGLGEIAVRLGRQGQEGGEEDPLARLEGKVADKKQAETATSRILDLQQRQNRDWDDPYEKSRRLRRTFRVERKGLERAGADREKLKDKMSLGIDLVDEKEEDRLRAGMVDFGRASDTLDAIDGSATKAMRLRPLFESGAPRPLSQNTSSGGRKSGRRPKTADVLAGRKAAFHHELTGNTRAAVDPFLSTGTADENVWQPETKRRRVTGNKSVSTSIPKDKDESKDNHAESKEAAPTPGASFALVDYGSDSS